MPKSSATIVLSHGAWADGSSWNKVIPRLQAKNLPVIAVQIPLTSLDDDVAATNRIIADTEDPSFWSNTFTNVFETVLATLRTYVFAHTTNRIDVELGARLYRDLLARFPPGAPVRAAPGPASAGWILR